MPFNPLNHPIALTAPRLLSDQSTWAGHIPFAMALVDMLRPKTIVELGTHQGDSYCSLCQAVAALQLPTQCTAIDTWKGDPHSGLYGPEVLARLRQAHDPVYAHFSRLIQTTFDEAAPQFQNGSIDLLHIDGLHTYEAVKHDYETWLPKMSPSGVILLHDVTVDTRGFGVRKLWEEIIPGRPNILFENSYGLGVVAVGNDIPPPLAEFFSDAARAPQPIRAFFARLGEAVELTRYLKVMASWQVRNQEHINQWKRRAGKPVSADSTDWRTVFADVLGYTARVSNEVGLALSSPPRPVPVVTLPPKPRRISIIICNIDTEKFKAVSEMYRGIMGSADFEIIGIHDAKSMAEGYNRAINKSTGDVLIFSHDDIEFITPDLPNRLLRHLQTYDLVGLAGTSRFCGNFWLAAGPPFVFGQVTHPAPTGGFNVNLFGAPAPIVGDLQALDGLFIAVNRRVFDKVRFDESLAGFHFYDLDFTASAHDAGFNLAVANDIHAIHSSMGSYGPEWKKESEKFQAKWAPRFLHQPPKSKVWLAGVNVATREEILDLIHPDYWKV
jgi:hypothetical protein